MILLKNKICKFNTFHIAIICLCVVVIFGLFAFAFAPGASAANADSKLFYTACANIDLNVRSGPGTDYDILELIPSGTEFELSGEFVSDGARNYWRLLGPHEKWVSRGMDDSNFSIISARPAVYTDTICGVAQDGHIPWQHICEQQTSVWYYHIDVKYNGYIITCDCGWFYERNAWEGVNWPAEDINDLDQFVFLGIDTDNDEQYDVKPGQSIDLLCRANSEMRPYRIMEFFGTTADDPPTVTLGFFSPDDEELAIYTFNWWVGLHVESYGIVMVDMAGQRTVFPIQDEFMLYCETLGFYLDETVRYYKHGSLFEPDEWHADGWHAEYRFTIKMVDEEDMNFLDWVIYWTKAIGNWFYDIFNFFGFSDVLYDDGSPFLEVFNFDGIQTFFATIGEFFSGLPPQLTAVVSVGFAGMIIVGLVRWFL